MAIFHKENKIEIKKTKRDLHFANHEFPIQSNKVSNANRQIESHKFQNDQLKLVM